MPSAPKNTPYWSQPIAETVTALEGSTAGLTVAAAQARLAAVGPNLVTEHEQQTALRLFLSQLQSPIMVILLVATLISAGLGDWVDAVIILIIVFGSAFLSFIQERNANQAIADLKAQVAAKTTVLRDGQMQTIAASQVVPGDVVLLSAGSLIPADSIVLEAHDLFVNQAVLTGETLPVEKIPGVVAAASSLAERTNMLFMGTNVRSGSARALVVQTGKATAFGQIADQLALRPPLTEFERGIRRLGYLLSEVMLLLVLGIFAVNVFFHKPVVDSLLFSVALAVGLTPQLLPAIINVNLAKGAQAMAAE
nr:HAD-IC family P-type ATPase [Caldilineaceae bacterium]